MYVSTGGFSKDARYDADRADIPLALWDLDDLVRYLIEDCEQLDLLDTMCGTPKTIVSKNVYKSGLAPETVPCLSPFNTHVIRNMILSQEDRTRPIGTAVISLRITVIFAPTELREKRNSLLLPDSESSSS